MTPTSWRARSAPSTSRRSTLTRLPENGHQWKPGCPLAKSAVHGRREIVIAEGCSRPLLGEEASVATNSAAARARDDCIRVPVGLGTGSMIPDIGTYLSPEHPIRPTRVKKNDRQKEERTNHKESLRARRRRGLPQGVVIRNDHGPQADRDSCVGQSEQPDGAEEASGLRRAGERTPRAKCDEGGGDGNR